MDVTRRLKTIENTAKTDKAKAKLDFILFYHDAQSENLLPWEKRINALRSKLEIVLEPIRKQLLSVSKSSEGGIGQKGAIATLRDNNIAARSAYSPYVGEVGVEVIGTEKQIDLAEQILFD
jgi:hypothetical protein